MSLPELYQSPLWHFAPGDPTKGALWKVRNVFAYNSYSTFEPFSHNFCRYVHLRNEVQLDSVPGMVFCPRTSCGSRVISEPDSNLAMCPKCAFPFCKLCRQTWHGPGICPALEKVNIPYPYICYVLKKWRCCCCYALTTGVGIPHHICCMLTVTVSLSWLLMVICSNCWGWCPARWWGGGQQCRCKEKKHARPEENWRAEGKLHNTPSLPPASHSLAHLTSFSFVLLLALFLVSL